MRTLVYMVLAWLALDALLVLFLSVTARRHEAQRRARARRVENLAVTCPRQPRADR